MQKKLLKTVLVIAGMLLFQTNILHAQQVGDYRSAGSGAWADTLRWETFDGANWVIPATTTVPSPKAPPTTAAVTVLAGHTVTISSTTQVKKLIIEVGGTLGTATAATGIRVMDSIINNGTVGASATTARINFEGFLANGNVVITGNGVYYIGTLRSNGIAQNLNIIIDANINITGGITGFYTTTTGTNTVAQSDDNVNIIINTGKTVTGAASGCYIHSNGSSILTDKFGNYTYTINGTLDLSACGTTALMQHDTLAASVVTLNVNGTYKTGTALRTIGNGASGLGTLALNIGTNGVVDATKCTNFVFTNAGLSKNAFFNITGNGKLIQRPSAASSAVTFNVGVNGIYSPVKLTGTVATDTFAVSVKNVADNGLAVVKKQWTITQLTQAATNVVVALGWQAEDNGTGFSPAGNLAVYNWNATTQAWVTSPATINAGTGVNYTPYYAAINTAAATFPDGVYAVGNVTPTLLPLHFISFSATQQPEFVTLSWATENEVNTLQFIVEKSVDNITYQAIGTVKANNTSGSNQYYFNDNQLNKTVIYYRLKQVDVDGKFAYSTVVAVKNNNKIIGLTLSPNPVANKMTVSFEEVQKVTTLRVINISGQQMLVLQIAKGAKQANVDVSALAAGQYSIIFDNELNKPSVKTFNKL